MRAVGGLHLDYVSAAEYHSACWGDVLGVASFNGAVLRTTDGTTAVPVAQVSMTSSSRAGMGRASLNGANALSA